MKIIQYFSNISDIAEKYPISNILEPKDVQTQVSAVKTVIIVLIFMWDC